MPDVCRAQRCRKNGREVNGPKTHVTEGHDDLRESTKINSSQKQSSRESSSHMIYYRSLLPHNGFLYHCSAPVRGVISISRVIILREFTSFDSLYSSRLARQNVIYRLFRFFYCVFFFFPDEYKLVIFQSLSNT